MSWEIRPTPPPEDGEPPRELALTDGTVVVAYEPRDELGERVLRDVDRPRRDLAGYHGTLEALDGLRRRCDRQREQLAALNAAHAPVKGERDAYRRQCGRLAEEAARLRELVRDMSEGLHCPTNGTTEGCPPCDLYDRDECECTIVLRMRELGIEVRP